MEPRLRKRIIMAAVLLVAGLLFWFLFSYSFISVTVQGGTDDQGFVYRLTDQGNLKTTEVVSSERTLRRLVRRGGQEIVVQQEGANYFAIAKAGGFLGTTRVAAVLEEEKARSFIGNNPSPCMYLVDESLLSIPCGDSLNRLKVHRPASTNEPSTIQKPANALGSFIKDVVSTGEGTIVLAKAGSTDEEQAPHTLYLLDKSGNISSGRAVESLDENEAYFMSLYKDGFIIYGADAGEGLYYSNLGSSPESVGLAGPESDLELYSVSERDNNQLLVFTENSLLEHSHATNPQESGFHGSTGTEAGEEYPAHSEVVFQTGSQIRHYTFEAVASSVRYCATNRICLLRLGRAEVYDISGNKAKLLTTVTGANFVESVEDDLLIAREDGILRLDLEKQAGSLEYSFGSYDYCGMQAATGGYVVCVDNPRTGRQALRIDRSQSGSDAIDKKILRLIGVPEVKALSIYANLIFVSPELGELEYDPEVGGFNYSAAAKTQANTAINKAIDDLKIDRIKYQIINSLD